MLVGFSCKNYASYNNETVFTMEASNRKEFLEFNTADTDYGRILKSAFIFGANGSGKSNLIKAISYMRRLVVTPTMDSSLVKMNETFKFLENSNKEPTLFEMNFIQDKVMYTYGFELLNDEINKEWLYRKVEKNTPLFIRSNSDWKSIKLYSDLKKAENIRQYTRKDSLFINTAAMLNINIAKDIIEWFNNLNIITLDGVSPGITVEYLQNNEDSKETILNFLKKADIGIDDFEVEIREVEVEKEVRDALMHNLPINFIANSKVKMDIKGREIDINTKHTIYNSQKNAISSIILPFLKYQSSGTIKFFELLGPILQSLEKGNTLIVDEIDSKLHSAIVRFIISLYNSIDKNRYNGQLICNTHDVLLLEEDIRRDQIWFVDKNCYGESELYSLVDFKNVRKNDSTLKKYLLGIYGAIPFKSEGGLI